VTEDVEYVVHDPPFAVTPQPPDAGHDVGVPGTHDAFAYGDGDQEPRELADAPLQVEAVALGHAVG